MKVRSIVLGAMLGALITAQQVVFAAIPNVSLTAFLIMVFAIKLDFKTNFFMILVYLFSRNLAFGSPVDIWMLYFIVFGGLSMVFSIFKKQIGNFKGALIGGIIVGFAVGIVSGFTAMIVYGWKLEAYWPYIVRGIPMDIVHGASNALVVTLLYSHVCNVMDTSLKRFYRGGLAHEAKKQETIN